MGAQASSAAESEPSAAPENDGGQAGAEVQAPISGEPGPVPVAVPQQQERQVVFHWPATLQQLQQLLVTPCRLILHRYQMPDTPAAENSASNVEVASSSSSEASADSGNVSKVKEEGDSSYCEEIPLASSGCVDARGACKLVEYSDSESDSSEDDIKVFTASRAAPAPLSKKRPVPTLSIETTTSSSTQSVEEAPVDSSSRSVAAALRKVKWEDSSDPESSPSVSSEDEFQSTAASPTAPSTKKPQNDAAYRTRPVTQRRGGLRMAIKFEDDSDSSTGSGSCSEDDNNVKDVRVPSADPLAKEKRAVSKKKTRKGVSDRKSSFPCTVCKKIFSSKSNLWDHMNKHTGEKGYKCEKCGRSFWCQNTYSYHKKKRDQRNGVCPRENKKHDGSWRPKGSWTCEICGKKMKAACNYIPHMKGHRGEKPFKCGECGKGFVTNGNLSEHSRIHSGVWQFTCVFCDKGFHFKNNLFNHLRCHTEENPYFCVVGECGASFGQLATLNKHRRMVHFKKY